MNNAIYVDQCDTIRTLTEGRSRSPQRGVQKMRKLSLALAALLSFAVSAEANPYMAVDATGRRFGPVIGVGTVIVTAPDGTAVAASVGPAGFLNSLPLNSSFPFLYLNDPTCTTKAYLIAAAVPTPGFAVLADENAIFDPSATMLYAKEPHVVVGSAQTYAWNYVDSTYVCQSVPLPSSLPIGPMGAFSISRPAPFSVVPWSP